MKKLSNSKTYPAYQNKFTVLKLASVRFYLYYYYYYYYYLYMKIHVGYIKKFTTNFKNVF